MRLVVGSPHGRSGKSTVTLGLISALKDRGLKVQPFKKGPDYIDPSWLTKAAGRTCRNLDLFFVEPEMMTKIFSRASSDADISIVEGAMGLYDGLDLEGSDSTATIAKVLKAPVVLVIDTTRMTRSAAALIQGFASFDPELRVGGVILNKVARPRHEDMLRCSIEKYTSIPVLGALPKWRGLEIADRHLGLVTAAEKENEAESILGMLGDVVSKNVDLDRLLDLAGQVPPISNTSWGEEKPPYPRVRIGIIRDHVFSFYYPENLECLQRAGAELVFVNSLDRAPLPPIDGLYIGGGFPEMYAGELEANKSLMSSIRRAAASGMPIYAECGGLMYLSRRLTVDDRAYEMAGVLPCETRMCARPLGHGYTVQRIEKPNYLFWQGTILKGHEFHHSSVVKKEETIPYCASVQRGYGCNGKQDGIVVNNVFASYCHIYAPACPEWAPNLVAAALTYRQRGDGEKVCESILV